MRLWGYKTVRFSSKKEKGAALTKLWPANAGNGPPVALPSWFGWFESLVRFTADHVNVPKSKTWPKKKRESINLKSKIGWFNLLR
jgi:hypothetical protein